MKRRTFVSALFATPFVAWASAVSANVLQFRNSISKPSGSQFPGMPPAGPPGQPPFPEPPKIDPHAVLIENQKNLKKDVERLYQLAAKLRQQVSKTNSTEVLSLDMIHTAEEIEKLAKKIRGLESG